MKRLIIAAATLSLLGGSAALAQDRDHDRREQVQERREINREVNRDVRREFNRQYGDRDHDGIPNRYDRQPNRYNYNGRYYDRFRGPVYYHPRGYAYRPWARGQYLPRAYFASPYYIDNWSYYRLAPPPYGYRYVRVGNDIVLVANANGLIANVIAGVFF